MMTVKNGVYVWFTVTAVVLMTVVGFGTALPVRTFISGVGMEMETNDLDSNVLARNDNTSPHRLQKRDILADTIDSAKKGLNELACNVLYAGDDARIQLCLLRYFIKDTFGINLTENGSLIFAVVVGFILLLIIISLLTSFCKLICGSSRSSRRYVNIYPNPNSDNSKLIGVEMLSR